MHFRSISIAGALAACAFLAAPAHAQFYKDKTLSLLINYGIGGNAVALGHDQYVAHHHLMTGNALLGAVAQRVLHHAPVPVLLVK